MFIKYIRIIYAEMKCQWIDTFATSYTENSSSLYGRDAVLMTHI